MKTLKLFLFLFLGAALFTVPLYSWQIIKEFKSVQGRPVIHVACKKGGPFLVFELRPNGKWVRANYSPDFNTFEEAADYWCSNIK